MNERNIHAVSAKRPLPTREELHRTYAGSISASDFNTQSKYTRRYSPTADRITSAERFDYSCAGNLAARKRRQEQ